LFRGDPRNEPYNDPSDVFPLIPVLNRATLSPLSDAFANSPHFTLDCWLLPLVDPLNVGAEEGMSPQGGMFALMLHAAWRDSAAGSPGAPHSALPSPGRAWKFREGGVPVLTVAGLIVAYTFGNLLVFSCFGVAITLNIKPCSSHLFYIWLPR